MRKIFFIALTVIFFTLNLSSINYFGFPFSAKFFVSLSAAYNYKISTDFSYQTNGVFMTIPLEFNFDFRFIEWFSINPGISFVYGINTYTGVHENNTISFFNHNLFIRLPIQIKFYPMVYKNDNYANFFLGVALFPHFWVANGYYYELNNKYFYGSRYSPDHKTMPPGGIYTPVNLGLKLSIGNSFLVAKNTYLGLELFADYLFIPIVNGYYNDINFKINDNVILDFSGSIGVSLSIGFPMTKDEG